MSVMHIFRSLMLAIGTVSLLSLASSAGAQEGKSPSVRAEIGKPIQAAQEFIKARKGKDALSKVREAEGVGSKTPYETYIVELTKGQAASLLGDTALAGASFELAAAAAPAGKAQLLAGAATQYYQAKNYAKAVQVAERYRAEGGNDPAVRTLLIQAQYLGGNLAQAAKELRAEVHAAEQGGQTPSEQSLQMLADIANRQKDAAGYQSALEKLVASYPKPNYWASLIYSVATRPGLSDRLALDMLRTKRATGTLTVADEYVEAAQLAIQAGFPAEANKFLEAGYDAHLLGVGAEAARHQRLKETTAKALAQDEKTAGADDIKLSSQGGDALLNTGLNHVFNGRMDKGLAMMEAALGKGTLKRPEDARLHVGMVQVMAGQKSKAIETLKSVSGKDGSADIARLWILIARSAKG